MRKRPIGLLVIFIGAVALACSSGSGGSAGGSTVSAFVDRLGPPYCDWLITCGKVSAGDKSACVTEFNKETSAVRSCAAAQAFYDAHRSDLEACTTGKPACATNDDPTTFCPALASFDDKQCDASSGGDAGGPADSGGGDSGGGAGSCGWHGNCSTRAPNGAYDCSGNNLMKCENGTWVNVIGCTSTSDSKGYACTCKGGCGTSTVVCSYASNVCEGHTYPTCGANATLVTTPSWQCK